MKRYKDWILKTLGIEKMPEDCKDCPFCYFRECEDGCLLECPSLELLLITAALSMKEILNSIEEKETET